MGVPTARCASFRIREHHHTTSTRLHKFPQRRLNAIMSSDCAAETIEGDGLSDAAGGELLGGCGRR